MQDESDQEAVGGIKMSEWISVRARLPEEKEPVIILLQDGRGMGMRESSTREQTMSFVAVMTMLVLSLKMI